MAAEIKNKYLVLAYGEVYSSLEANFAGYESGVAAGVTWTSSNPSIVSVIGVSISGGNAYGKLTAGSVSGKAIVKAFLTSNPSVEAKCEVTVQQTVKKVTGITVTPNAVSSNPGQIIGLMVTVYPQDASNQHIRWEHTSGDNVALTVNRTYDRYANVEALKHGTSVITAISMDGGFQDTATISVTYTILASRVVIEGGDRNLVLGESASLIAYCRPPETTNKKVNWSSSNSSVASVTERGTVTAVGVGTATLYARSDDGNAWSSITVTVRRQSDPVPEPEPEPQPQPGPDPTPTPGPEPEPEPQPQPEPEPAPYPVPDYSIADGVDSIVRIDYNDNGTFVYNLLYSGNLNFDLKHPIESVVYQETDEIKKIYWVDGKNVLRSMNFMAKQSEIDRWEQDNTQFDSNKGTDFDLSWNISKDYAGNTRPNGVIQYILTYYNLHGQETGPVWTSDLIYLSPSGTGGPADGHNTCRVTIRFSKADSTFTNYRLYSMFRSSENGQAISYIVSEGTIPNDPAKEIVAIDDYANQTGEDASRLLYLGSQPLRAGTLTHKDQTLFLGDITGTGRGKLYEDIESVTKTMRDGKGIASYISFAYADGPALPDADELYPYENQLKYTSSEILTFKGGEKYRFALVFKFADGTSTDAFWIGDKENTLYPKMEGTIQRVIAKCQIPTSLINVLNSHLDENGKRLVKTVQLMIAEATYADRSVKAQGIINPTVFNVWDRFNDRVFAQASWISRPRNSGYANRHFESIKSSTSSYGEIDCNYWVRGIPTPYYTMKDYDSNPVYNEEFDGINDYDYVLIVLGVGAYGVERILHGDNYQPSVTAVKLKIYDTEEVANALQIDFTSSTYSKLLRDAGNNGFAEYTEIDSETKKALYKVSIYDSGTGPIKGFGEAGKQAAYAFVVNYLLTTANISAEDLPLESEYYDFCESVHDIYEAHPLDTQWGWINYKYPTTILRDWNESTFNSPSTTDDRWNAAGYLLSSTNSTDYFPSYYKKHLMFVDENIITLNSPELEYERVSFDNTQGLKLRIVGVAKVTGSIGDYTVDATPGKLPGENLIVDAFSSKGGSGNIDGLISWPLWNEYGLSEKTKNSDGSDHILPNEKEDRTSDDYNWGVSKYTYWLHMWNHAGKINGYTDEEGSDYSKLNSKVFANLRVCTNTVYNSTFNCVYDLDEGSSLRIFNYTSSQYVGLYACGKIRYYDGIIKSSLFPPGSHRYPILYSLGIADTAKEVNSSNYELTTSTPVPVEYYSSPHAVISLPTWYDDTYFYQEILPRLNTESVTNVEREETLKVTGALLPWIENNPGTGTYPYIDAVTSQKVFTPEEAIASNERYLFIGEIYYDYSGDTEDSRYGGTSEAAIQNNRFLVAGPQYRIDDLVGKAYADRFIIANRGDTYFQRWDCLKTKPYKGSVNGVIDITSVMLETHINLDGRTDLQRGISQLASIDTENFGLLNNVYSQKDNFVQRRDLSEDFNLDSYRSTITWTLQKNDLAQTDEWMHITLANTLKLDGDRGICRALRRMQNSIIAFQDKGISEILFNSRTQLSTTDGVPVEIANSGKVDGKRYITNKYGCINKWSIVEGKTGLYFIDNINKAFCLFSGDSIDSLSDKLGFGVWFKDANDTSPWTPSEWNNIVSFYDREHSDIYLVRNTNDEMPCLVYNENLQAFTSFFDYSAVPMITNVRDRLVSFYDYKIWLQNEGLYCNFFGNQYDFWVQYRVTPDPFSDKIWTNFDYRADFYHLLDEDAKPVLPEEYLINGDKYGDSADIYKEDETFSFYKVWNEYQTTDSVNLRQNSCMIDPVRKKFRIWRVAIARAMKDNVNIHGLDRIRNPWINLLLKKHMDDGNNQFLMQLHDVVVKYFE